jgi:DNA-directed RNA polymerase specialized sigma54-like protein
MTLDEIREKLKPYNLRKVAPATGLHYNTVYKYVHGEVKQPRYVTMKKLEDFLK